MPIFDPSKQDLERMRAEMSNIEIAATWGVSLSTVKRRILLLDVASRPTKKKPESKREKARYVSLDEGVTLMEKCQQILGPRMSEDRARGYLLDGRPASSAQVIKAAGLQLGK